MSDVATSKTPKTAIVTGASSGIGLGITMALLEQGYRVSTFCKVEVSMIVRLLNSLPARRCVL